MPIDTESSSRSRDEVDNPILWEPSLAFVKVAITALLIGCGLTAIALRIFVPQESYRLLGPGLVAVVSFIGWVLQARGHIRTAVNFLAIGVWVALNLIGVFTGGVYAATSVVFPVVVLLIGWLISARAALVVGALTVLSTAAFVVAQVEGFLPHIVTFVPALHGAVQAIMVSVAVALIVFLVSAYQNRLKEIQKVSNTLMQRSAALETHRVDLNRAQAVGNVGSWIYEPASKSMSLSAECCRIFGVPEGHIGTRDGFIARLPREDQKSFGLAWSIAQTSGLLDIEHRIYVAGSPRWIRQRAELEFDTDGILRRVVGVAQDVTERKAIEVEILAAKAQLQATLDAIPDMLFEADLQGQIYDFRSPRTDLLADGAGAMVGGNIQNLLPRSASEVCMETLRQASAAGHTGRGQFELQMDEATYWFELTVAQKPPSDNQGQRFIALARDVTERKNAELSQLESESKFRTIIEATPVPLVLNDSQGNITYVNKAFLQTIGYSIREVPTMQEWWVRAYPIPQYRKWVMEKWKNLSNEPETEGSAQTELEVKIRCVDGTDRTFLISTNPLAEGPRETTLMVLYDITERIAAEESIRNLVFYDQLTNLPNRRLLLDRLKQALASSTRNRKHVALLFIDLDNFKTINDTHGHTLGDLLLKQVSQRLSSCVRFGDTVARLGGDEFVVMLEDLSEHAHEASDQAEIIGNKIISTLNRIYQLGTQQYHNTASIGLTLFVEHRGSLDDLLTRADLAMYQAKAAGRNALCFFDPNMQAEVNARAALEAGMRDALLKSQFMLYYQPQVDGQGRPVGAECLLRWQHPNGNVVSPADFIPLAEETRLIVAMGQWVLQTACRQLSEWATQPVLAELTLAVNVSVHQFHQDDFVAQVLLALERSGANPKQLKLELTESLLVSDVEEVVQKMLALKAKGVGLSLDDFGTGYSSLNYLKRLPLDQLKIDRSFVQDLPQNGDDAAIVKTIISLGHNLGLSIMAEGVETQAQRDFLGQLGCSSFQGYLFGVPLAPHDFERWAHQH